MFLASIRKGARGFRLEIDIDECHRVARSGPVLSHTSASLTWQALGDNALSPNHFRVAEVRIGSGLACPLTPSSTDL